MRVDEEEPTSPVVVSSGIGNRSLRFSFGAAPRARAVAGLKAYLGSIGAVALALGCGFLIERFVGLQSVLLGFLMAILAAAVLWGLAPSLLACVLSALAFDFFFLPPLYTFTIADPDNALALVFFIVVAIIVSNLAAATRAQVVIARASERTTTALYEFSRKLAAIGNLDDLLWAIAYQTSSMLGVRTVVMLPAQDGGGLTVVGGYPPDDRLPDADTAAARRAWEHNAASGRGAQAMSASRRLFLPLRTNSGPVGVIGVDRDAPGPMLAAEERRLLDALAHQAAVAIERVRLSDVLAEARVLAETERLRSALLTSISHDLRTPLASIIGAVSSLRGFSDNMGRLQREELLSTVQEEAERLNRLVGNLLDMTRLESGVIEPQADYFDLEEIVGAALRRAASMLAGHEVMVDIASDLPMLRLDAVLFEQVLFNLLDNAAKFAPAGTRIDLRARHEGDAVTIEISDEGPGIPEGELALVFNKFHRVRATDRQGAGSGLGLAICRGFVEALGGAIDAANRRDRSGAIFTLRMPVGNAFAAGVW